MIEPVENKTPSASPLAQPQIVEYDSQRVIGVRYAGKNKNNEIMALWGGKDGFVARMDEIEAPEDNRVSVGVERCLPGVHDGSFEYIAAVPAKPDAPIPSGMVEARLAAGTYAVFTVSSLSELPQTWAGIKAWFKAHPEWESYCDNGRTEPCGCLDHPAFELYPPDFLVDGRLFQYVPVRRKD